MSEPAEFNDETILEAIDFVTSRTAAVYSDWVQADDIRQELAVYAYGKGRKHINRWLADGEKHRLYLALFAAAKQYGLTEKGAAEGWSFDDQAWYTPEKLRDVLPLALDPVWDALSGESDGGGRQSAGREGGTLIAMVADVRAALRAQPAAAHVLRQQGNSQSDEYAAALVVLADQLGGEYPSAPGYERGRRRVLSNESAQWLTHKQVAA